MKRDRRCETIAPPRYVDYVARAILPVTECATKRCDMHPNIGFFDDCVRPYQPGEFSLVNNVAGPLDQDLQNCQSSAPDVQRPIAFEQKPLRGNQSIGPESYSLVRHMDSNQARDTLGRRCIIAVCPEFTTINSPPPIA